MNFCPNIFGEKNEISETWLGGTDHVIGLIWSFKFSPYVCQDSVHLQVTSPKFLGSHGCLMVHLPGILFSFCPKLYLVKWVYRFKVSASHV